MPLVAVPTTAGSGSEVTPFATVWSATEPRKLSLGEPVALPGGRARRPGARDRPRLGADALDGLDAFVQCFESIWNRNATPVTSAVAERGLVARTGRARHLKREPHALDARSAPRRGGAALGSRHQPDPHRARSLALVSDHRAARRAARAGVRARAAGSPRVQPRGGRRPSRASSRTGSGSPSPKRSSGASLELYRELGVGQRRPPLRRRSGAARGARARDAGAGASGATTCGRRTWTRVRGILRRTDELLGVEVDGVSKLGFLKERRTVKEFESLDASFRELVFYSEGSGDWPHLGPVVESLLRDHDRTVTYLSSDPDDPGLAIVDPRLRTFMIGSGTARTILFARIDCEHFVMTLPDLDQLWLKRSAHPVHYVYLFHSMNSTHAAYRKDAFDAYDTVLCVGPYQVDEIRRAEELRGLPAKELVEHGSVKLDTVLVAGSAVAASDDGGRATARSSSPRRGASARSSSGRSASSSLDVLVGAGLPDGPAAAPDDRSSAARARRERPSAIRGRAALRPRGGHERDRVVAALRRHDQRLVGRGARVRLRSSAAGRLRRYTRRRPSTRTGDDLDSSRSRT